MVWLSETLLSVALLTPLSTLMLRLFLDAFQYSKTIQQLLHRIQTILALQTEILQNSKHRQLTFHKKNICKFIKYNIY